MANQSANKVGSIKLPNGCHTQAGTTLKALFTSRDLLQEKQESKGWDSQMWGYLLPTERPGNCPKGSLTNPK
jgi:hypothetical protein